MNFSMDWVHREILSFLIFFPLLISLLILITPVKNQCFGCHKKIAFFGAFFEFIFSLHLIKYFIPTTNYFQFAQISQWFGGNTGIQYIVGVDGLNLCLVLLTTTFGFITVFTVFNSIKYRLKEFLFLYFILQSALIGVFVSLDVILFYLFWELSLIPLYFMIGIWGGKNKIYATIKFFIYGVLGSLFMLISFGYLYVTYHSMTGAYSSNLLDLYRITPQLPIQTQFWLFLGITTAFLIKIPVFPFYTWLTDTYEQAPSVYTIMSGVMLKLSAYGLIRMSLLMFPLAAKYFSPWISALAIISILYGAIIAWQQTNMRRLMAFSSLSHLGFIVLGIFSFNMMGLQGAIYQMINHAITAGAIFILLNFLMERRESQNMNDFGGLAAVLPWFSFFFVVAVMGSVALPSTGSFIGEWLILNGSFHHHFLFGTLATLGVIFGAVYMLWMTYKVLFGPLKNHSLKNIRPMNFSEVFQLSFLTLAIFILGFSSRAFFDHSYATLSQIEKSVNENKPYFSGLTVYQSGYLTSLENNSEKTPVLLSISKEKGVK